jgi:hypothetical protein
MTTHARRAAELFRQVAQARSPQTSDKRWLGCDLGQLIAFANRIASSLPAIHPTQSLSPVAIVFDQLLDIEK